jgi:hypothetical protein
MVVTMIYDHEWNDAEMRRNFGVLFLSFPTVRRNVALPLVKLYIYRIQKGPSRSVYVETSPAVN